MKKLIETTPAVLFLTCLLLAPQAVAQTDATPAPETSKPAIGLSGGHYRYDPGVALEFTTRAILQNHMSMRVKAGMLWLEDYKAIHDQWVPYYSFSAGVVYNGQLFDRARFFAELGVIGIAPNPKFSDSGFVEGLYQFNGLEITLLQRKGSTTCLFFGVGPAFVNAFAEKIEGRPRYGRGLHFINGLRVYIGK